MIDDAMIDHWFNSFILKRITLESHDGSSIGLVAPRIPEENDADEAQNAWQEAMHLECIAQNIWKLSQERRDRAKELDPEQFTEESSS